MGLEGHPAAQGNMGLGGCGGGDPAAQGNMGLGGCGGERGGILQHRVIPG